MVIIYNDIYSKQNHAVNYNYTAIFIISSDCKKIDLYCNHGRLPVNFLSN